MEYNNLPDDYPKCLAQELLKHRVEPTGNAEWDKGMLRILRAHADYDASREGFKLHTVVQRADEDRRKANKDYPKLDNPSVLEMHKNLFIKICNEHVLSHQHRKFIFDDENKKVILFLLLYFNNSPLAEEVFPDRGYKLHKNIMLQGDKGVGKTLLMQCFSEYLMRINSPRAFHNMSVQQMVNHYQVYSNLNSYTFNENKDKGFLPQPINVCLNDVGLEDKKMHFGTKTAQLTDDFLLARNDIWQAYNKFSHITTNLDTKALVKRFSEYDSYNRIIDRFKTYNVIPMWGASRR